MNYSYKEVVQFANLPIEVKYGFDYKKINCALFAGVNSQYVLKQQAELDLKTENVENILSYTNLHMNKFSLAGICGLSMDVKLTKKISLFVEPHFKINFTKLSKSSVVVSTPYFFGANSGLKFHF